MKAVRVVLGALALGVAGCESMSDTANAVREKFGNRDESQMRTFQAPPRVVYEAVRAATREMGYRFVRGGPAQGEFEAINTVARGDAAGSSRQLALKAHLHATLDGKGTELTVYLTEVIESDSSNRAGMATETPLRDTPQYEVFFRHVQQALDQGTQAAR